MNLMKHLFFSSFIFFFLLSPTLEQETNQMRFAFTIFRHGARSPYSGMTPTFVDWFGYQWSGVKELTAVGLRQHYLLGFRNNLHYIVNNNLLSEVYDPREIYVISTDSNRTLLSANAQLQGLYQANKDTAPVLSDLQIENAVPPNDPATYDEEKKQLKADPLPNKMYILPVHTFFTRDKYIQLQDKKVCPGVKDIYDKNEKREVVQNFFKEITEKFGQKIGNLIGETKTDFFYNYTKSYSILDNIITLDADGRDTSKFEKAGINFKELLTYAEKFFDLDFVGKGEGHDEIGLISMSPIFRNILSWMQKKIQLDIEGKENYIGYDAPKFIMYSAHDSTVGAFEAFMKAVFGYEVIYAKFAANAHLELLRTEVPAGTAIKESDYKVRYLFDDKEISVMPFTEFKNTINGKLKTAEEIETFCKFPQKEEKTSSLNGYMIATIVLGVVAVCLIGVVIYLFMKKSTAPKLIPITDDV